MAQSSSAAAGEAPNEVVQTDPLHADSDAFCGLGYEGWTCRACSLGFYEDFGGSCSACPSDTVPPFEMLALPIGCALLALVVVFAAAAAIGVKLARPLPVRKVAYI